MRLLAGIAAALALTAGCAARIGDRIVSADGTVAVGRLLSIGNGSAEFEGFSLPVPEEPARVLFRSGASYRGDVVVRDRVLEVGFEGGVATARLRDVACIIWGDTAAGSVILDVPAAAGWLNTHLEVRQGSLLSISSGGRAVFGTGSSGPEGLERTGTSLSTVTDARDGSLVARIGDAGDPFPVGASWGGMPGSSGELWLAVNTPAGRQASGVYTASIALGEVPGRGSIAIYPGKR
jgi:hypothetical protein